MPKVCRVIDFETTGLPPSCGIIEVGWTDVAVDEDVSPVTTKISVPPQAYLTNPNMPSDVGALAVHHIRDTELQGKPHPSKLLARLHEGADYFVAHNAKFERQLFKDAPLPWICTMKVAQQVLSNAPPPSFSNQVLRYFLHLQVNEQHCYPPHRAGPDTHITAYLLCNLILRGATLAQMVEWSGPTAPDAPPQILETVTFGKHAGKLWKTVPSSYILWMLANQNPQDDVRHTMLHTLKERGTPYNG